MDGTVSPSFRSHNKAWEYAVQHNLEDGEGLCLARPSAECLELRSLLGRRIRRHWRLLAGTEPTAI